VIEWRIDEQLECKRRPVTVACEHCDRCGEIAARTCAAKGQPRRVESVPVAVLGDPARCRVAILERGGKRVLGRAPVGDRENRARRRVREPPADRLGGLERAEHPAASEEVGEHGQWAGGGRQVHACGDRSRRPRQHEVANLGDGLGHLRAQPGDLGFACVRHGELVHGTHAGCEPSLPKRLGLGMKAGQPAPAAT
jgi:hypothetical protein